MTRGEVRIVPAAAADVAAATACMAAAFARDPLITFFFSDSSLGRERASATFFSTLLRVRLALGMPALIARDHAGLLGIAMGYRTDRPAWPEPLAKEWAELEASAPGIDARFEAYERISDLCLPPGPHYYLGVLGTLPAAQGKGVGAALLQAFCRVSAADPLSQGVYLETANAANLPFYRRHGFELRGEGALGAGGLWCLFHPH